MSVSMEIQAEKCRMIRSGWVRLFLYHWEKYCAVRQVVLCSSVRTLSHPHHITLGGKNRETHNSSICQSWWDSPFSDIIGTVYFIPTAKPILLVSCSIPTACSAVRVSCIYALNSIVRCNRFRWHLKGAILMRKCPTARQVSYYCNPYPHSLSAKNSLVIFFHPILMWLTALPWAITAPIGLNDIGREAILQGEAMCYL